MSTKFAKKGHLVVDVPNAKLAKVGDTDAKSKKVLKDANVEEFKPDAKGLAKLSKEAKEKPGFTKAAKPTEKAKAEKPKAEKVAKEQKGEDKRKLKLLVKENPKREGTAAYDRFELYKGKKTVQEFLDAGGTLADVKYDAAKGLIEVA